MIKQEFLETLKKYTTDGKQQQTMWSEVEKNYSRSERHYHNLAHLDSMLAELKAHKDKFDSWDTIIFAITYHDFVYCSLKKNNEERSAEIASKRLSDISFPDKLNTFCRHLILATKKHERGDPETNLFTDADLSILGSDSETYKEYSKQIRREYSIVPDILYVSGRRKVLMHFLKMGSIYKTKEFLEKYELAARNNIQAELTSLTNGII